MRVYWTRSAAQLGGTIIGVFVAATVALAQGEVLPASEAAKHVGESRSVEFIVRSTGQAVKGGTFYLNSELNFRLGSTFAVVINKADVDRFPGGGRGLEKQYVGKQIRVKGKIEQLKTGTGIQVSGPAEVVVTDKAPANPDATGPPPAVSDDFDPRPPSYLRYYLIGFGLLLLPVWAVLRVRKKRADEGEETPLPAQKQKQPR